MMVLLVSGSFFSGGLFFAGLGTRGENGEKKNIKAAAAALLDRKGQEAPGTEMTPCRGLSLSLSFSLVFILRFLFFLLKSNLRRLKEKKP